MTNLPYLNQLILEIDLTLQQKVWSDSQRSATDYSSWQTYLNQLTLDTFIGYVREEQSETVTKKPRLDNIGELVNGTAIEVGDAKLVLIPSEADDLEELRVPQEWVDIPQWRADYYVAIQIDVDDNCLRLWGYTTHQQLKNRGHYDVSDRSYSLDSTDMIDDINALWVARELCPDEVTKTTIPALKEITPQQANNLIQRLGNTNNLLPRLSIPFTMWAALITNDTWRNNLIAKRRGKTKISVLEWLKAEASNVSNIMSEIGWRQVEFQVMAEGARGETATATPDKALAKKLAIAGNDYDLKLIPLDTDTYGFELRSRLIGGMIPAGFTLRLLSETGEGFPGNEDIATTAVESLYLEVALEPGEGLIWEIEPIPDDYQGQVLYF